MDVHRVPFGRHHRFRGLSEQGGLNHRHPTGFVEECQMADLVSHRPTLRGSGSLPRGVIGPQGRDERVEIAVLVVEIHEQFGHGGHVTRLGRRHDLLPTHPTPLVSEPA